MKWKSGTEKAIIRRGVRRQDLHTPADKFIPKQTRNLLYVNVLHFAK